jgi:glycosyltransferase involved in cell wall biosynthesis
MASLAPGPPRAMKHKMPAVIVLGPERGAVSGVSTHLNLLFGSDLARNFVLVHFQVGSEGRHETMPGKLLRLLISPFALAVQILWRGAAAVHINTSLNPSAYWRDLAYLLAAKLCGAHVIYQVHGGELPRQFAAGSRIMETLLRASLQLPDVIVVLALSELEAYREFVPKQMVVLLPNSIDLAPYAQLSRPPAPPPGDLRLLYIGRLARDKGLHDVLAGIAKAQAHGVTTTLVIAGSGPDEVPLKNLVQKLALEHAVRFTGPLFDDDKLALYGQADILMLATYHAEGLPYALLESMAAGVPAISTRVGAIPDVMVDGVHGLFVPAHDDRAICMAIERLANDRFLLAEMGVACRRRIAHSYTVERMAGSFDRLYSRICTSRANVLGRT